MTKTYDIAENCKFIILLKRSETKFVPAFWNQIKYTKGWKECIFNQRIQNLPILMENTFSKQWTIDVKNILKISPSATEK